MGAIAGMRSMSAPKMVSQFSEVGIIPEDGAPMAWLNHPTVSKALDFLSTGERIADKLPFIPARTQAGPLIARGLSGGISGAAISARTKRPWWAGALIGAATAIGASFGAYRLRKWIHDEFKIPDAVTGVVEDAVVAAAGYMVLSTLKSSAAAQQSGSSAHATAASASS